MCLLCNAIRDSTYKAPIWSYMIARFAIDGCDNCNLFVVGLKRRIVKKIVAYMGTLTDVVADAV